MPQQWPILTAYMGLQGVGRPWKGFMDVVSQEKHSDHNPTPTRCVKAADVEFWTIIDQSDWKLNPVMFRRIISHFGPLDVDVIAS